MTLTLNTFENEFAALNKLVRVKPDHYVMNVTRSCASVVEQIHAQIRSSNSGQLLYGIDLRVIFQPTGNAENWTLEACSTTKSLAIVGTSPTA